MVSTSEDTIFIFTVCKKQTFYEFSANGLTQKGSNVECLSEITKRTLTFRDRTVDVTNYDYATLLLHATSARLSSSPISCVSFLQMLFGHLF